VDEARFVFEFIDRAGASPTSVKPGGSGMGAPPAPVNFDGAPGKAWDNNERSGGGRPTSGGAAPGLSAGAAKPTKDDGEKSGGVLDSLKAFGTAGAAAIGARGLDVIGKAAQVGRTGIEAAQQAGKAISDARAANEAAAAAAKSAPLEAAKQAAMMGVGTYARTAATTAATSTAAGAAGTAGGAGAAGGAAGAVALGGPVAWGVAATVATVALPVLGAKAYYDTGTKAAEAALLRGGEYSPEVAAARAQAEVNQIMADLRTSRRLGPELAQYTSAQSDLSIERQRFGDSIAKGFLPEINSLLQYQGAILTKFNDGVEKWVETMNTLKKYSPAFHMFNEGARKLKEAMDKDDATDTLTWFEKQEWVKPDGFSPADGELQVGGIRQRNAIPGLER
jgi:hypothetical protein